jgi:DNA replication and repair protein RecF
MRITRLRLRDFRSYTTADVRVGPGVTVVHGRNGTGKTNLLEALYVGCTGASWRTASDRELVRFGADVARVELDAEAEDGAHAFSVGLEPGKRKRVRADGVAVDRLADVAARPLAAVFLPDRLDLVKGGPALRRAHVDQVVAALWPARAATRREYGRALAQRNALLARGGPGAERSLDTWDAELARHGAALMADRASAIAELAPRFAALAEELGLEGGAELTYRPRSPAADAAGLADELRERRARDLERRFTAHGPHRDDLGLARAGRDLRPFGSQGQQRLAVLALLLAEREAIGEVRGTPPVMLLDDAMSELDAGRRERLVARLCGQGGGPAGQSVITTTDLAAVPGADAPETTRLAVADGVVLSEAEAHAA